jgi:hypothetical protein
MIRTLIDLRLQYQKETGNDNIPISHDHCDDVEYIVWLEEHLLRLMRLKQELIPWENLDQHMANFGDTKENNL